MTTSAKELHSQLKAIKSSQLEQLKKIQEKAEADLDVLKNAYKYIKVKSPYVWSAYSAETSRD